VVNDGRILTPGCALFALAICFFGAQYLVIGRFVAGLAPGQEWTPALPPLAYIVGLACVVTGVALLVPRWSAQAALIFAIVLIAGVVLVNYAHLPDVFASGGPRTRAFEPLAMAAAALVLAGYDRLGRYLFAFSMCVFGMQHFLYTEFIASLIPPSIPARPELIIMGGVAFIAAGIGIATNIRARLAGLLLGVMFLLFIPLAQVPAILARPHEIAPWTSLFVPIALCGGAWIIASARSHGTPVLDTYTT
jgi:uncharacterized membrane protein